MIIQHGWGCRTIDYPVEPAPRRIWSRHDPTEDPTVEIPVLTIRVRSRWSLRASQLLHVLAILALVLLLLGLALVLLYALILVYAMLLLSGVFFLALLR
jgi:hypothetical protein